MEGEKELIINLFGDNVLIKELAKEEKSVGGIILADYNPSHPVGEGLVVQAGPDCKKKLKGYKVYFNPNVGWDILKNGKQHVVMSESGIIATFETRPKIIT